jgi:hypothetical protein
LCGLDSEGAGAPIKAIPLQGTWDQRVGVPGGGSKINDPNLITFACKGGALAKCVTLGYKPWKTVEVCTEGTCTQVLLDNYHQACTRMIRADYCGNGQSWTLNGELINLYDGLGVQVDTEEWPFEAEWDVDGARCVVERRVIFASGEVPACLPAEPPAGCGDPAHFASGVLLMNEHHQQHIQE